LISLFVFYRIASRKEDREKITNFMQGNQMKITKKSIIKYLSLPGIFIFTSFSCQAGDGYIGYHIGMLSYDSSKSATNNNIKLGYLDSSVTPLRFGAEATFSFSPDADVYYGTFSHSGFSLLGIGDYSFSEKWHVVFKSGLGFEQTKCSSSSLYFKEKEAELFPMAAAGIFWNATQSFDIGLTMHYQLRDNSWYHKSSTYGTLGFNYYLHI